jgi:hypothetical protein
MGPAFFYPADRHAMAYPATSPGTVLRRRPITKHSLRACPETGSVAGDRICFRANEV